MYKELLATISELREEVRLLKNGKKSKTSHTPPSHEIGRSNSKNSRISSGKRPGGQLGHDGNTLSFKVIPDAILPHVPTFCNHCGLDLNEVESIVVERRQEVVIPPIQAKYLEHVSHAKICTHCGCKCVGTFPEGINAPIQYSGHIGALVAYLSVFQYMPYKRITMLLKDLFNLPISEGTVDNLLATAAQKAMPAYEIIQQRIQQEAVVGADETGASIGGKKGWFHTWQSEKLTFIVASMNRGYQTITQYFSDGFPLSVYVSDCWAAQLKVTARLHQLCIAHLLRELNNFEDALSCQWSIAMKLLFQDAIQLKKQLVPADYDSSNEQVLAIQSRLDKLLIEHQQASSHKKVQAFINRLIKNKESILTFLYHQNVPPDNNASERAIRNVKVKSKVSGQFRTEKGATRFAILRSVIDTTRKSTNNVLYGLIVLLYSNPV